MENVLMCPAVMGAVRSLLGPGFGLPILISNHRASCPAPAQGWHHDGDSHYGPEVEILQVDLLHLCTILTYDPVCGTVRGSESLLSLD